MALVPALHKNVSRREARGPLGPGPSRGPSVLHLCLYPVCFCLLFGKWRRPLCNFYVVVGVLTGEKRKLAHTGVPQPAGVVGRSHIWGGLQQLGLSRDTGADEGGSTCQPEGVERVKRRVWACLLPHLESQVLPSAPSNAPAHAPGPWPGAWESGPIGFREPQRGTKFVENKVVFFHFRNLGPSSLADSL